MDTVKIYCMESLNLNRIDPNTSRANRDLHFVYASLKLRDPQSSVEEVIGSCDDLDGQASTDAPSPESVV